MDFLVFFLIRAAQSAPPEIGTTFFAVIGLIILLLTHAIVIAYGSGRFAQKLTDITKEVGELKERHEKSRQLDDVRLREIENTEAELAMMLRGIADNAKEIERLNMKLEEMARYKGRQ